MYVATARSMRGPWRVRPVTVAGEGALHVSNPSVAFIRPGTPAASLGKVAISFRYNSPHGENPGQQQLAAGLSDLTRALNACRA